MQAKLQEQLSPADAEVILGRLPEGNSGVIQTSCPFAEAS